LQKYVFFVIKHLFIAERRKKKEYQVLRKKVFLFISHNFCNFARFFEQSYMTQYFE